MFDGARHADNLPHCRQQCSTIDGAVIVVVISLPCICLSAADKRKLQSMVCRALCSFSYIHSNFHLWNKMRCNENTLLAFAPFVMKMHFNGGSDRRYCEWRTNLYIEMANRRTTENKEEEEKNDVFIANEASKCVHFDRWSMFVPLSA